MVSVRCRCPSALAADNATTLVALLKANAVSPCIQQQSLLLSPSLVTVGMTRRYGLTTRLLLWHSYRAAFDVISAAEKTSESLIVNEEVPEADEDATGRYRMRNVGCHLFTYTFSLILQSADAPHVLAARSRQTVLTPA